MAEIPKDHSGHEGAEAVAGSSRNDDAIRDTTNDDDDDDGADLSATMESARARAEKRRRRILEKAGNRMQLVNGEETGEAPSRAARIRAARQKRYGKKPAPPSGAAAPGTVTGSDTGNHNDNDNDKHNQNDNDNDTGNHDDNDNDNDTKTPTDTVTDTDPSERRGPDAAAAAPPRKKYMGVARTRREMLRRKKEGTPPVGKAPPSPPRAEPGPDRFLAFRRVGLVLLLFAAGVDVGHQQFHPSVDVRRGLAPLERGIPPPADPDPHTGASGPGDEPEPAGTLHKPEPAGPGVHRRILGALVYGPARALGSLLSLPAALWRTPPGLFLLALVLRRIAGRDGGDPKERAGTVPGMIGTLVAGNFPGLATAFEAYGHLRSDMYVVFCGVFLGLAQAHLSGTGAGPGGHPEL